MRKKAASITLLAGILSILVLAEVAEAFSGVGSGIQPQTHVLTVSKTGSGTIVSSPAGINCGSDCSESYEAGTEVTLTATADDGWVLTGWDFENCDSIECQLCELEVLRGNNISVSCPITIDTPINANITFVRGGLINVTTTGSGTVVSSPDGITCGCDCSKVFFGDSRIVTLTANPAIGGTFIGWEGDCSGTGPCVVDTSQHRDITAEFTQGGQFILVVSKTGAGTIVSSPAGINCGSDCSESYEAGTEVTLTIEADSGWAITDADFSGSCNKIAKQLFQLDLLPPIPVYSLPLDIVEPETIAINFSPYQSSFNLTFPLQNRNAYNARITAVFDHSMLDSYCPDDKMVTYSGEETTEKTPYSPIDPIGCGPLYSFYKPGGGAFLVGKVNYVGIRSEENNLVLQYDAHPGYDYPDDLGTPVLAAAEGDLSIVYEAYGWVKIIHDGVGTGYETHYLHLNDHIDPGRVARGQVIGEVGSKGESSGNHLHFEVRYQGIPVDPYGWEGSGTDPYTTLTGAVNVRLWETLDTGNPWIDYLLGSPADMVVTDPDGLHISKELNQIPRATYDEVDIDGDGDLEDRVSILHKKVGGYLIDVIPESNALPTDTYSLEAVIEGQTMVLAQDAQIQEIPAEPYIFESKLNRSDFDTDGDVDYVDLAKMSQHWLAQDCNYPDWCEGTDLNYNGFINFIDFGILAEDWLWAKIPADIDIDGDVDFTDFAILASQWRQAPGVPSADIAPDDGDGIVDFLDLAVLTEHWLEGTTP